MSTLDHAEATTNDAQAPEADAAGVKTGAHLPALQYLLALAQRVGPEEKIEIDRAVSWLFVAAAAGAATHAELEGVSDKVRARVIGRLTESREVESLAARLVTPFTHIAASKLTDDEVDVVLAAAEDLLPGLFTVLAELGSDDPDHSNEEEPAASETTLSSSALIIFRVLASADPRHVNNWAKIVGVLAESYALSVKHARPGGKPDLADALTGVAFRFPDSAPEVAAVLLPTIAQALTEPPSRRRYR